MLMIAFTGASAQAVLDTPLHNIKEGEKLTEFLGKLEEDHPVRFFYLKEWLQSYELTKSVEGLTLQEGLKALLLDSDMGFIVLYDYAVIFLRDPTQALQRDGAIREARTAQRLVDEVTIGDISSIRPGEKVKLSGRVTDQKDGSVLTGVMVNVSDLGYGVATNEAGEFEIIIPAGERLLSFRYVNYVEKLVDLRIYSSGTLTASLEEVPTMLEEVVVSEQVLTNRRISQATLNINELKRTPTFLGEVDIIKQIQSQPGVTSVGEVTNGFNVRGGGVDQNLVLYDGVPVFNTAHAFGFVTAFNVDAISDVSFYRGGIPAEFGGRVSSVLNISGKEGNYKKTEVNGGIGLVSSYLAISTPVKRDVSSLLVSLRTSYSDWLLDMMKTRYRNIQNGSVSFYDGSVKYSQKLADGSKLTFSGYISNDLFSLANDTTYRLQNMVASLRYDKSLTPQLYSSVTLNAGRYSYRMADEDRPTAFDLDYGITYPSVKLDFNYDGPVHNYSFGFHNTYYHFNPGTLRPKSGESNSNFIDMDDETSLETALYFSDAFYWRDHIFVEAGLRYSIFNRFGPGTVYQYEEGGPREPRTTEDSVLYSRGRIIKTYHGLEPRLSIRYSLSASSSIKFGYNRMFQYVHLISNTAAVTPVDIWQSSNPYFKPQIADQLSIGYYRSLKQNTYETFGEVFYKHVNNLLDFKDGAELILNPQLETALVSGNGEAYGIELSLTKVKGRLSGNVNYTYSRTWRTVQSPFPSEQINLGRPYPANFDQPHVANLNWRYSLNRRVFFSGNFTYRSGRPVSLPLSAYYVDGVPVSNFSERNQYRISDYHRLDLALTIEGRHLKKKKWDGTCIISLYNVYARKNAYSVFFVNAGGFMRAYQLSLIGTIVPSVTYTFKF